MIDVAIAIDLESTPVTRLRDAPGVYTDGGRYIDGIPGSMSIHAAIQPANGRQLMDLPEGIRTEAKFLAWSRSDLQVNDRLTVGKSLYKIIFTWPRPMDGFNRAALGLMTEIPWMWGSGTLDPTGFVDNNGAF